MSHVFAGSSDGNGEIITIQIGHIETDVLIDSQASCNIMDKSSWLRLKDKIFKYTTDLKATDKKKNAYGSQ